ncbi:MAG: beta-ketoacyl-[acyl-carrier-protein] synthase family protein [Chitinivibrionales bacterium]
MKTSDRGSTKVSMLEKNCVVVTGLGLLCGSGLSVTQAWPRLCAGTNQTRYFSLFEPQNGICPFGVELPEGAGELFRSLIKPRSRKQMTRGTSIAFAAAAEAIKDAGLNQVDVDSDRIGVVCGTTGTACMSAQSHDSYRILRTMPNAPAAWISLKHKFTGPSLVVSTACSSGIYALHTAYMLIATGQVDIVVAGAADSSLNQADVQGFDSLMALADSSEDPQRASRPFDRSRSGFVMAEGGGMLVLESWESARRRKARPYARLHLPAVSSEAYNILLPQPDGAGMAKTMSLALSQAGLSSRQISYINAHGTSTQQNDRCETMAIKKIFGPQAYSIPVSSTKSVTGHTLAAAAGVEAVICCKALQEGIIPPTINLNEPDPECDLDYVPHIARNHTLDHIMCNSFAFGGHNGVAIFSKINEEC